MLITECDREERQDNNLPYVELCFSIIGKTLPADHGYALYSALKQTFLEGENFLDDVLLSSISGLPDKQGKIYLNKFSQLRLRFPAEKIQDWYRLQNLVLNIRGHLIHLVRPKLTLPIASKTLKARMVTFNLKEVSNHEMPVYFLESCQKALTNLDIKGQVFIDSDTDGNLARRALKIKEKHVVGFGIVVEGLSEKDSIKLQSNGLGGRKHFGCGWFFPTNEVDNEA